MKLDILAFGAHPDDIELTCSGTLIRHIDMGYRVGLVDLTRGELGTRGTAEIRDREAAEAARLMGAEVRENMAFEDGFFVNDKEHQLAVIKMIRRYKPHVVFANVPRDRHPDHGRGSSLVTEGAFLSGLKKIETEDKNGLQQHWRPQAVYHYLQAYYFDPDFVVDISDYMEDKIKTIKAYKSQFYTDDPQYEQEEQTFISDPRFMDFIYSRATQMGKHIGAEYAEGFLTDRFPGVPDVMELS
ncbi:MAG: bacillithiol biosynthesis deacetylase BshB1 [Bacteroidetes bacterium SW_11_45_7]|nr:MAG: bacillithiol biosynthesis deacetylase BshB1 [Bacteroidetes bacterium SW_11_45_7]